MSRNDQSGKEKLAVLAVEEQLASLMARLDELETRTAFQDDLLNSLNDVIAAQDSRMATLARLLEETRAQLNEQGGAGGGESGATAHEPPPHY